MSRADELRKYADAGFPPLQVGHFEIKSLNDGQVKVDLLNADGVDPRHWPRGTPFFSAIMTREAFRDEIWPQVVEIMNEFLADEAPSFAGPVAY